MEVGDRESRRKSEANLFIDSSYRRVERGGPSDGLRPPEEGDGTREGVWVKNPRGSGVEGRGVGVCEWDPSSVEDVPYPVDPLPQYVHRRE